MLLHGWWPSFLKVAWYRLRGHRIGRRVSLGFGAVICAEDVEIGDDSRVGPLSFVRSRRLRLGQRVQIGAMCLLDTPTIEIGDDTKLSEQVYVGGLQFPDSRLTIGRNCQVMQMTFINPTCHITIGDDTGIGGDSLLFGHSSWLSQFEGYPVVFQPIEIGSSVSLAWRVFVSAGAKIGDGAVIGANSFVNHVIPPRCLATGSPARVVARAPYFPRQMSAADRVRIFEDIFSALVAYLSGFGAVCSHSGNRIDVAWQERSRLFRRSRSGTVLLAADPVAHLPSPLSGKGLSVFVSLPELSESLRRQLADQGVPWIDLARKERSHRSHVLGEEVVQFLRRYGVRLNRAASEC